MLTSAARRVPAAHFDLDRDAEYRAWRALKLRDYPRTLGDLIVEVRDPRKLTASEHAALANRCARANMALYASPLGDDPDRSIPLLLGQQLGLERMDHNWLADPDGMTSLTVASVGDRPQYIPYTNHPIHWHTDGYYNRPERQIHGLLLHCVHPAAQGGENALFDHELAYLLLRDANPDHIRALMQADAMTIPPGTDENGEPRPASTGPVFSVDPLNGKLHMRYTARTRNVEWKGDVATQAAREALDDLLHSDSPYIFRGRLEAGMGLVSNNVLHDRSGFEDVPGQPPRLLYRCRYFDRITGT